MPDLVKHIASFARFAANREEREREDAEAMRELALGPLELPRGLELEWLGVAGYRLSAEGQTIYIDPYLSRVPLASVIRRRPALADTALHSKLLLGYAVPFDGELTCEHLDALSPAAYRCGQVWGIRIEVAGMTFYHQGSANLIDEALRGPGVDVFLAGIAGRSFTRDYWKRILPRLQPRTIVASHFDDFFRPVDAAMGFSTNVNLAAVPEEVAAVSRDFTVATLLPMQPILY